MKLKLQELNLNMENEFFSFLKSFENENIAPAGIDLKNKTFNEYLLHLDTMKNNPPRLLVPQTILFLINEDTNEILGAVSIRHFLSAQIVKYYGQISYAIKKECRGKKLAEKMMRMAKDYLVSQDIKELLVISDKDNIASYKTILSLNGELENEIEKIENNEEIIVQRFWVQVDAL